MLRSRHLALMLVTLLSAYGSTIAPAQERLVEVAAERHAIWNGVAITPGGRIFVNYPSLSPRPHLSVAEIDSHGIAHAYPSAAWNQWRPGQPVREAFVGTNAVRVSPEGNLWVVDTGSPDFGANTIPGAARIICIDLTRNRVKRIYPLGAEVVRSNSYIDDIRFHGDTAYLTDAGVPGLIVLDLRTGHTRRVLDHDRSTTGTHPIIVDGNELHGGDGKSLILHADQMEVSPDGCWFYFQPLSGPLSRVETRYLDDSALTAAELSRHVEPWYQTTALGGTAIDAEGNLYLEVLENNSIVKLTPDRKAITILQDPRLHWADAPAIHDGWLYLPVAQIDRARQFHQGHSQIQWPLYIYKLNLNAAPPSR